MEYNIKIIIVILFLAFSAEISFSHEGHTHKKINDIESAGDIKIFTITESKNIDYSLENDNCFLTSASECNCCFEGVCFGFDSKCGPNDCNGKKHSCMHQCSQNESNGIPPVNSNPSTKIKINLTINNTSETISEKRTFKVLPTKNLYQVSTPTYITVRALLI